MSEGSTQGLAGQGATWETLSEWVQGKVQELIQEVLEAEVTELLGRCKSQRREAVDAPAGYRNGHGEARRLTLGSGTVAVRRPRVRGWRSGLRAGCCRCSSSGRGK